LVFCRTKKQAILEVIKAYRVIDEIIKNPEFSLKSNQPSILTIRDVNLNRGIVCIIAGFTILALVVLTLIALNLSSLGLMSLAVSATLSGLLLIGGVFLSSQGLDDNKFCYTFEKTMPRFFGKQDKGPKSVEAGAAQKGCQKGNQAAIRRSSALRKAEVDESLSSLKSKC
jgi:hypothetical protein